MYLSTTRTTIEAKNNKLSLQRKIMNNRKYVVPAGTSSNETKAKPKSKIQTINKLKHIETEGGKGAEHN